MNLCAWHGHCYGLSLFVWCLLLLGVVVVVIAVIVVVVVAVVVVVIDCCFLLHCGCVNLCAWHGHCYGLSLFVWCFLLFGVVVIIVVVVVIVIVCC